MAEWYDCPGVSADCQSRPSEQRSEGHADVLQRRWYRNRRCDESIGEVSTSAVQLKRSVAKSRLLSSDMVDIVRAEISEQRSQ